ncbi:MAG: FAD-dependent oxidoreductase [Synergistaceae bacterium]|nr:FAD-dependent oxidoreductase [Synergistaceae bacterium]
MKYFDHIDAESFESAGKLIKENPKAKVISGGTDLLDVIKQKLLAESPECIVNLKTIPNAEYITEESGNFKIGALTKLSDLAESEAVRKKVPILAEAAGSVATPIIRNSATVGGNICQDTRCWYYRYPHEIGGRMTCLRKGGEECYALHGKSDYHSVFGGVKVHLSPCVGGCPAGTDIPGYLEKLREDDIDGAARIIMRVNPFPALTARVCAHLCQENCNHEKYDERVGTGNIERYVGDYVLENSDRFYIAPKKLTGTKVGIVGAGPAGLSAAYYLRKEGHSVTIYDKMEEAGGMLQYAIPAYRLPKSYVQRTVAALQKMGVEFILKTEIGKDIMPADLEKKYDKIFYDIGAWKRTVIGLEGEELTIFGLDFLIEVKNWMEGKLGTDVLVVGGGNVAMDVAVTAKRLGAANVTLVCVESEQEMPAGREEVERCREADVKIINSYGVKKVLKDGEKINGMELVKCTSVFDEAGRYAPVYDQSSCTQVKASSILMAVGQRVDLSFLDEKYQLQLTESGLIAVDKTFMTSKKGVYAGGDVTSGPATVIEAIAAGHGAAAAINRDLGVVIQFESEDVVYPCFMTFDPDSVLSKESVKLPGRPFEQRTLEDEDYSGLTWEQTKQEASRCYNCCCLAVNPSDISPVLLALDAVIKTNMRDISAADFFTKTPLIEKVLSPGEIVKEIEFKACAGYKTSYTKFRLRDAVDFAIVSLATAYKVENGKIADARIVLGGVAPVPYRMKDVEAFVKGKAVDDSLAAEAGDLSCAGALCLGENKYKLPVIKSHIKDSLKQCLA